MTTSTSRFAYEDCYALYEQAIADPKGIRIPFDTYGEAKQIQMRLNRARVIDRAENRKIYHPDDPMFGRSAYDGIQCKIQSTDGRHWVFMERIDAREFEVESLSDGRLASEFAIEHTVTGRLDDRIVELPKLESPEVIKRRL